MSRSQSSLNLSPAEVSSLLKLFPKGIVAVDLETTGLSPLVDKIIEIEYINKKTAKLYPCKKIEFLCSILEKNISLFPNACRNFEIKQRRS